MDNRKGLRNYVKKYPTLLLVLLIGMSLIFSAAGTTGSFFAIQFQNQSGKSTQGNDWWSMFHHDPMHSGFSTAPVPDDNQLLWSYHTYQTISSSPVVSHGRVYISSWDWKIYCFDMDSGNLLWNYSTTGEITSAPAVANGKVYVSSMDTKLYCLNALNGSFLWAFKTDFIIESSPIVVDGKVIIGASDGSLYCLDANAGSLIWEYQTNSVIVASPAAVEGNIYVGDTSGNFYCINSSTGNAVWVLPMAEGTYSSPSYSDGMIYFGSNDENVYCLDASTGGILWNYSAFSEIHSSPAVAYDSVFVGTSDGRLLCLDKDTGGFLWSYQVYGSVTSSPAVADGKVYFDSDPCCGFTSYLVCLNAYAGTLLWEYNLNTQFPTRSSPALAAGKVFVGAGDGTIFAFGDIVFMADANGPYYSSVNTSVDFMGSVYGGQPGFSWEWEFGDGATSTQQNPSHTYSAVGEYLVTLTVTDSLSHSVTDDTKVYIQVPNTPPEAPLIDGPATGDPEISYEYDVTSLDIDDDMLLYYIDWGDNTTSGWLGPYHSGMTVSQSHLWSVRGAYLVKAKAKDQHGAESNWSEPFEMRIVAPVLAVEVKGGLGVITTITNVGDAPATNVSLNIFFEGSFVLPKFKAQRIGTIEPNGTLSVRTVVFGVGGTSISALAFYDEWPFVNTSVQAKLLLFFVFGVR
ncbi:MAG: PQQ-binding-like beta-propeller repeat protein [Candidatus Thermoplasmatota archaeon]|nr:PQQ-binding-like beta-propeller repeat protein [Candidatus Thermoplasmatota archaeon]